jgi:hypothetical protein
MLIASPVKGKIKPDKKFYPNHPLAVRRPAGSEVPLVTLDFGPTSLDLEPRVVWPGGESNLFGMPIAAKTYEHFHPAIDISKGPCGADVLAVAPGKVRVSKLIGGAGTIVINHGVIDGHRYETGYVHLSERIGAGVPVVAGKVIGTIGDGGISTGCHLHFFIEKDGKRVDPWRRLKQNTLIDPDAPVAPVPVEDPAMPMPASDAEYLAGQVAVIGNASVGAFVRTGTTTDSTLVRTIPAGAQETWLPTCWVKGEVAFGSDRWLTRWRNGQWEFTHSANVRSVTPV